VAKVLGASVAVVLVLLEKMAEVRAGAALEETMGAADGVGSTVLLAAGVVTAPAIALDEAGATAVELAGPAALVEEAAGLEAPADGEPVMVPKVRS
jgi:hypothetical protein